MSCNSVGVPTTRGVPVLIVTDRGTMASNEHVAVLDGEVIEHDRRARAFAQRCPPT